MRQLLLSSERLLLAISCNFGQPDCGTHGLLTEPCSCICNDGWATDPNQDFSDYHYCNITTSALEKSQGNVVLQSPSPLSSPTSSISRSDLSIGGLAWYLWVIIMAGGLLCLTILLHQIPSVKKSCCQLSKSCYQLFRDLQTGGVSCWRNTKPESTKAEHKVHQNIIFENMS